MTELLHLPDLDKWVASFEKLKTLPPRSCNNPGECLPNFQLLVWSNLATLQQDTWRGECPHMLHSFNKYLTVKLMDNLTSQSSMGGKSSFCEPKLAIFASFCTRFSKTHALRSHDGETAPWSVEVCTKTAPSRESPLTHSNRKRHRSIWLQRLCKYSKLSNILVKTSNTIPKILRGVLKTP